MILSIGIVVNIQISYKNGVVKEAKKKNTFPNQAYNRFITNTTIL